MNVVRDILISLLVLILIGIIYCSLQGPISSDLDCSYLGRGISRCVNDEVVCYKYFSTSIQCKFKEPHVKMIRYTRD